VQKEVNIGGKGGKQDRESTNVNKEEGGLSDGGEEGNDFKKKRGVTGKTSVPQCLRVPPGKNQEAKKEGTGLADSFLTQSKEQTIWKKTNLWVNPF